MDRVLKSMLENANIAIKGLLKVILVRAQKEKRKALEKAPIAVENTYIIMNRLWVECQHWRCSGEVSDGNEKHIIGIWRKGNPC